MLRKKVNNRFKIYKETYDTYKDTYTLPNGKPDIRKIKKEAVDKLIAEHIVNQLEGNTEFPSLQEEANRNLAQRLFDAVLDFIKSLYNKSKVDIFANTAAQIVAGEVGGTVADIKEGGIEKIVRQGDCILIKKKDTAETGLVRHLTEKEYRTLLVLES